ncbi:hypothetical protein INR49_021903 [Caranx melampygus]|nr:hypothetical protein INR49_021903 [Caranx melampygus]
MRIFLGALMLSVISDPQKLSPPDPEVPEQTKYVMRYYKTIPIGVVLVLSLVLWRRWKISRASQVEMDNSECLIR